MHSGKVVKCITFNVTICIWHDFLNETFSSVVPFVFSLCLFYNKFLHESKINAEFDGINIRSLYVEQVISSKTGLNELCWQKSFSSVSLSVSHSSLGFYFRFLLLVGNLSYDTHTKTSMLVCNLIILIGWQSKLLTSEWFYSYQRNLFGANVID